MAAACCAAAVTGGVASRRRRCREVSQGAKLDDLIANAHALLPLPFAPWKHTSKATAPTFTWRVSPSTMVGESGLPIYKGSGASSRKRTFRLTRRTRSLTIVGRPGRLPSWHDASLASLLLHRFQRSRRFGPENSSRSACVMYGAHNPRRPAQP